MFLISPIIALKDNGDAKPIDTKETAWKLEIGLSSDNEAAFHCHKIASFLHPLKSVLYENGGSSRF